MTFLPIVGRELRVASRRRGTYWTRVMMAGGATAIGGCILLFSLNVPAHKVGNFIFIGLAGLSLLFAMFHGRQATADSLSAEKREGTLGLLFLTDLKGHDVVLGKIAATSLGGLYGLMAVLPVLSIPLLLGGITIAEFCRVALVLVNTFVFSLSIGIVASALCWDARQAMAGNFLLLLLLSGIPPAIAFVITAAKQAPLIHELFFSCPVYTFYLALASPYAAGPRSFWLSLALTHALTWMMIALACRIVPHRWQDRPDENRRQRAKERWRQFIFGNTKGQPEFRAKALDRNAYYWLAARARRKPLHVWLFLAVAALWWCMGWATSGRLWLDPVVYVVAAVLVNTTFKIWLMIEAGQRFTEDHQSGALEVLLSTPLTVHDIVRGQWLALRRQFARPLLAVLGIETILLTLSAYQARSAEVVPVWTAGMTMLIIDMVAGGWVSMWLALSARKAHQATLGAVLRILVVPWLLIGGITGLLGIWFQIGLSMSWDPSWKFYLPLWFTLGLCADLLFGLSARSKLERYFREFALRHLGASPAPPGPGVAEKRVVHQSATRTHQRLHLKPRLSRRALRRLVLATVVVVSLLLLLRATGVFPRPARFPPPVVVTLRSTNAPLQVVPGPQGAFFILPDRSLWSWATMLNAANQSSSPQRLDEEYNWIKVAASYTRVIGLRTNGTLHEWPNSRTAGESQQFDDGTNWVDVATYPSGKYVVAVRRDGTLWEWGDRLPVRLWAKVADSGPKQVGTNDNWAAVSGHVLNVFGLQTDGSLWIWGQLFAAPRGANFTAVQKAIPDPTRFSQETNWVGWVQSYPWLLLNKAGEAWELTGQTPSAEVPAAAVSRLVCSNVVSGRFAAGYGGESNLYEIRSDGTLWRRRFGNDQGALGKWRRVGRHSDWVRLYAAGPTTFGLTRDGTLWMWGYDPTRTATPDIATTLKAIRMSLSAVLGGGFRSMNRFQTAVFQSEPRPILKMAGAGE